jgi:hypothetical protein
MDLKREAKIFAFVNKRTFFLYPPSDFLPLMYINLYWQSQNQNYDLI